jgi:hypothetical protein
VEEKLANAFLEVWRQAMQEKALTVELDGQRYPVKKTSRHRLRQVDFVFQGNQYRGLEQNPETSSRWARMAREGQQVMQFLSAGQYLAVIADGKIFPYSRRDSE